MQPSYFSPLVKKERTHFLWSFKKAMLRMTMAASLKTMWDGSCKKEENGLGLGFKPVQCSLLQSLCATITYTKSGVQLPVRHAHRRMFPARILNMSTELLQVCPSFKLWNIGKGVYLSIPLTGILLYSFLISVI